FFFQAEDGIRDKLVTGVQTCALPICWPLLGYGVLDFGAEVDWLRDPASGARWPLRYHGDVTLARGDGSDARVLWELNRLGHLLKIGRASCRERGEHPGERWCLATDRL